MSNSDLIFSFQACTYCLLLTSMINLTILEYMDKDIHEWWCSWNILVNSVNRLGGTFCWIFVTGKIFMHVVFIYRSVSSEQNIKFLLLASNYLLIIRGQINLTKQNWYTQYIHEHISYLMIESNILILFGWLRSDYYTC